MPVPGRLGRGVAADEGDPPPVGRERERRQDVGNDALRGAARDRDAVDHAVALPVPEVVINKVAVRREGEALVADFARRENLDALRRGDPPHPERLPPGLLLNVGHLPAVGRERRVDRAAGGGEARDSHGRGRRRFQAPDEAPHPVAETEEQEHHRSERERLAPAPPGGRRRLVPGDFGHGGDETVAAARDGGDVLVVGGALAERLAQDRDVARQAAFLDERVRPDVAHQYIFLDHVAMILDEQRKRL